MTKRILENFLGKQLEIILMFFILIGTCDCYIICSNDDSVCNNVCYNPNTQQCLQQYYAGKPVQNSFIICAKNEQLCGVICYNPGSQQCLQEYYMGKPVQNGLVVCEKNQQLCGSQCYTPGSQKCTGK
jgi:hypothetical protein